MDDRDAPKLYEPDPRDFTEVKEYAGMIDELAEKMKRQAEEGRPLMERDWGTAIAVAVNLRAADADFVYLSGSKEKFLEAYKRFTAREADLDFSFMVCNSLLQTVLSKEDIYKWGLRPMSLWLEDHVVEIFRKKLEESRLAGGNEYETTAKVIRDILFQSEQSEELVTEPVEIPERIKTALEEMLTEEDEAAAGRATQADVRTMEKTFSSGRGIVFGTKNPAG